ncbi:FHA domain-containing protein, partial [Mycobacterium simiae]
MTRAQRPVLTVRSDRTQRSFAAGPDVVVGSDPRADFRVAHPLIAHAHLLLRFEQSNWIAIDNNSPTGIYVNGRRVPLVDIHDGLVINLGRPDGPRISFEVRHHRGMIGLLPATEKLPVDPNRSETPRPPGPAKRAGPRPPPPRPAPPPNRPPDPVASAQHTSAIPVIPPPQPGPGTAASHFPTGSVNVLSGDAGLAPAAAGIAWIGRSLDNDIVVSDVLASRHHAYLTQTRLGTEIRDAHSINGTFVNG